MKIKSEMQILVSSPVATELFKKLFINGGESLPKVNIPNLADYSTRFKDILDNGRTNKMSISEQVKYLREFGCFGTVQQAMSANCENCGSCLYWDSMHGGCKIHNTVPGGCKDKCCSIENY